MIGSFLNFAQIKVKKTEFAQGSQEKHKKTIPQGRKKNVGVRLKMVEVTH